MLLSAALRDVGSGHSKKRWAHSAGEHAPPFPEANTPSNGSRHSSLVQHEHIQSLPPHGGGGGQALERSKRTTTLPGEFAGSAIAPSDGHLRTVHTQERWLVIGHFSPNPSGVGYSAAPRLYSSAWLICRCACSLTCSGPQPLWPSRCLGVLAARLANRDEQAAASHDSADSAWKEKCTYTLRDAGQPGHVAASQQEQSQLSTKLQRSSGAGGGVGGRLRLTLTLIFCPYKQWSHVDCPPRWHEKYSMPSCWTTAC